MIQFISTAHSFCFRKINLSAPLQMQTDEINFPFIQLLSEPNFTDLPTCRVAADRIDTRLYVGISEISTFEIIQFAKFDRGSMESFAKSSQFKSDTCCEPSDSLSV